MVSEIVNIWLAAMEFLIWLESLPLSVWVRESGSLWGYPTILFLHTVGLAISVGLSAVIALRVAGVSQAMPLEPLAGFYPILWIGFWINALSGLTLLMADASFRLVSPVFQIKIVFVTLAMLSMTWLRRRLFCLPPRDPAPVDPSARAVAVSALLLWAAAITAGRWMAYV